MDASRLSVRQNLPSVKPLVLIAGGTEGIRNALSLVVQRVGGQSVCVVGAREVLDHADLATCRALVLGGPLKDMTVTDLLPMLRAGGHRMPTFLLADHALDSSETLRLHPITVLRKPVRSDAFSTIIRGLL